MADEAAPAERGVEVDEGPQLGLVAPDPGEDHDDAPRRPRRRPGRPVEAAAAAGPHGQRRPLPPAPNRGSRRRRGRGSEGLRCSEGDKLAEVGLGWDGNGREDENTRGGVGRFGVWFGEDWFRLFILVFCWLNLLASSFLRFLQEHGIGFVSLSPPAHLIMK